MKRTLGKVTVDLGFYDRLKSDLDYANERSVQLDILLSALGCSEEEAEGKVKELLENQMTAEVADEAKTGRLVCAMPDGARLQKDDKGWQAFGGNAHPEWYRGPHPINALSGAGIKEAE